MQLTRVGIILFNLLFYSSGVMAFLTVFIFPRIKNLPEFLWTLSFVCAGITVFFIPLFFFFIRCPHCKTRVILKAFQIDWKSEVLDISPTKLSRCPTCGRKLYD